MKISKAVQFAAIMGVLSVMVASGAQAQIDGHGPDAWRVTGVAQNDALNVRMGPGTQYPVIESFSANERGLQQITCVPLYTPTQYNALTAAQTKALPPRWCLMRNASMTKAGWVAQRFITPDHGDAAQRPTARTAPETASTKTSTSASPVVEATAIVRKLYDAQARAERGQGTDPLQGRTASNYFTSDIVDLLRAGRIGAHPLYGAQDFDGRVTRIAADPEQPMLRGMVTVHVDFTNFGEPQRATFYLRADTTQRGSPLRIFRVEHDGWSYP
ncbi:hypothetical protein AB1K62_08405 [Parasphingorhabdus sp. JC815]|uniref:hypothetical protein n=1 Tax=Parasphingorhabdus sp. JC815 TaxID=3232140 RepID=UPI00345A0AD9